MDVKDSANAIGVDKVVTMFTMSSFTDYIIYRLLCNYGFGFVQIKRKETKL